MVIEEMYIDGVLVRSMHNLLALDDDTQALIDEYGRGLPERAQYIAKCEKITEHGYYYPTWSIYCSGVVAEPPAMTASEVPGWMEKVKDIVKSGDIASKSFMVSLKVNRNTGRALYKILTRVPYFGCPIPPVAEVLFYGFNYDKKKFIDQVDVYYRVDNRNAAELAKALGLPNPVPPGMRLIGQDMIGATYKLSNWSPIRLKYYHFPAHEPVTVGLDGWIIKSEEAG